MDYSQCMYVVSWVQSMTYLQAERISQFVQHCSESWIFDGEYLQCLFHSLDILHLLWEQNAFPINTNWVRTKHKAAICGLKWKRAWCARSRSCIGVSSCTGSSLCCTRWYVSESSWWNPCTCCKHQHTNDFRREPFIFRHCTFVSPFLSKVFYVSCF